MKLEDQVVSFELSKRIKHCPCCKTSKPLSEFYERKNYRWNSERFQGYCKPCNIARNQKYFVSRRKAMKTWRFGNPEIVKKRRKRYNDKLRLDALMKYSESNTPSCACCCILEIKFLAIDHINGHGNKHRKTFKGTIYSWLRKNNYPKGFQVLCHNCNMATHFYGRCPHAS